VKPDPVIREAPAAGTFDGLPAGISAGFTTRLFAPDGTPADQVVRVVQVHGRGVIEDDSVPVPGSDRILGEADAVVSRAEGRLLSVFTADCLPLLLADEASGWMAAIHAGWRGTSARIVDAVLDRLEEKGVRPSSLFALFGPAISGPAYEVGPEVADSLRASFGAGVLPEDAIVPGRGDRWHVDLGSINESFLVSRGVRAGRIRRPSLCTLGDPRLFPSYRRDGPGTGRIATGIVRAARPS
jgi:YfiH family protein